jgi:hypothetical protein
MERSDVLHALMEAAREMPLGEQKLTAERAESLIREIRASRNAR